VLAEDGRASRRWSGGYDADALVGFACGYTGEFGQWWTDRARVELEPQVAGAWLGGHFELVSIGVAGAARRAGIGRGLVHALLDRLPHERLFLMTSSALLIRRGASTRLSDGKSPVQASAKQP
jgi:ribosomal protein S18 acetylase RimI-like enzyme